MAVQVKVLQEVSVVKLRKGSDREEKGDGMETPLD